MEEFSPSISASINKIIKEENFLNPKVKTHKIDTNAGSYQGVYYEVTVTGQTDDGQKETNIYIKHLIENYESFKLYPVLEVYRREAFVYNELSTIFNKLENEAKIPEFNRIKMVKNYECSPDAIILENIVKRGYKTMPRLEVIPLKFAVLSVEQLAKFHALSFALKDKNPEYYNDKIKTLKQSMTFDETYRDFMKKMFDVSINVLDEKRKNKVADYYPTMVEEFQKYVRGEKTRVKCLCHGDFRISNIFMKECDGEITEVIPIDYQQVYYGSPLIDFIYLILTASDCQFRKDHLNNLKHLYFTTLQNFLHHFKIDVTTVYPREEFEKDFKTCMNYGLMVCMYFMPFFFVLEEDTPDLNDELLDITFRLDSIFKDRLSGVIDDFVEWGYL